MAVAYGVFVGLSTIDIIYGIDEFPPSNSKIVAKSQNMSVGGPAANASVTFGHLGGKPTLATIVGRHPLTGVIREELQRYQIRLIDLDSAFDEVPVMSSISVNEAGERNIVSTNAARVHVPSPDVDKKVLEHASVVLVDGHYLQACEGWAKAARSSGRPVVLDGGSWKEGTKKLLMSVDTAICSADFLPPGCSGDEDVFSYLKSCGVRNMAITRGAEPIRFVSDIASGFVSVPQVPVLDTLGAGDIFHGAFCYYASIGEGFAQALGAAAKVAAESCRFRGTREWMKRASL